MTIPFLLGAFFLIALIYSSVGFGGGSSYLALMGAMAMSVDVMRPTALLCNIVVVTGGTIIYFKNNLVDLKKSWPFLVASVPFAFIGGMWKISDQLFFELLGVSLVGAAGLLWTPSTGSTGSTGSPTGSTGSAGSPAGSASSPSVAPVGELVEPPARTLLATLLGAAIGFLSGLVSIGGGIFLAPVLHLLKWGDPRKIAALASLFILVNSVGGFTGMMIRSPKLDIFFIVPLLVAVFAGGQIGSRLGARRFPVIYIKRITAVLIFVAGMNILKDHWAGTIF